jgi:hypothetical protein
MGNSAQQQQQSQVYYDSNSGQYYTVKGNPQQQDNPFYTMFANTGIFNDMRDANRNYLGNPFAQQQAQQSAVSDYNYTPYDQLTNVLPELNNASSSLLAPTDGSMSGAGRFLAPSNTSKGK